MRPWTTIALIMSLSLSGGCASVESVRKPDVEATIKIWRTYDGIITQTTIDGKTYRTKTSFEGIYE